MARNDDFRGEKCTIESNPSRREKKTFLSLSLTFSFDEFEWTTQKKNIN